MKSFWDIIEKLHFDPRLTPFWPLFAAKCPEPGFCQTCGFREKKRTNDLY